MWLHVQWNNWPCDSHMTLCPSPIAGLPGCGLVRTEWAHSSRGSFPRPPGSQWESGTPSGWSTEGCDACRENVGWYATFISGFFIRGGAYTELSNVTTRQLLYPVLSTFINSLPLSSSHCRSHSSPRRCHCCCCVCSCRLGAIHSRNRRTTSVSTGLHRLLTGNVRYYSNRYRDNWKWAQVHVYFISHTILIFYFFYFSQIHYKDRSDVHTQVIPFSWCSY